MDKHLALEIAGRLAYFSLGFAFCFFLVVKGIIL